MVTVFCFVSAGTVGNFFPTIVKTLGYSPVISLLLTAPPYILCVITACFSGWHADRTGEHYFHIVLPLFVAMAAFMLAATTTSPVPRYIAMMLMIPGVSTSLPIVLSWEAHTLTRPPSKRAVALAAINTVGSSASIYTSYMYPDSAGPRYVVAMSVNCTAAFMAICMATLLRFILTRLNRKLDEGVALDDVPITNGNGVSEKAIKAGFRYRV